MAAKAPALRPTFSTSFLAQVLRQTSTHGHRGLEGDDGPGAVIPDFLYIGSAAHALSEPLLASLRISHVLTITAESEFTSLEDDRVRLRLQVRDTLTDQIGIVFSDANRWIDAAREASGRCLVHCIEGRSRSCTLILAYLMHWEKKTLAEAWDQLKVVRPEAFPNFNFWSQLHTYEGSLFQRHSELPDYVKRWLPGSSEKFANPESVYEMFLTSSLNDTHHGRHAALAAWSGDWKRLEVMRVLQCAFEKIPPQARQLAVDMLEALCKGKRLALEEAAHGLAEFFEDEELAEEHRLDVPQYDIFKKETLAAATRAGLTVAMTIQAAPPLKQALSSPRAREDDMTMGTSMTPKRMSPPSKHLVPPKKDIPRTVTAPPPRLDRDHFTFPDGQNWSLPSAWRCKETAQGWRDTFKLQTYRSLRQDGEEWLDEHGKQQVYRLDSTKKVVDVPMRSLAKPQRARPRGGSHVGCFLERGRLERVLDAMMQHKALPPVLVEVWPGMGMKVANGFHRYFASLILGFKEIPVELLKSASVGDLGSPKARSRNGPAKQKWVPASVRRRMEEEAAKKAAEKQKHRSLRRVSGTYLVNSEVYDAEGYHHLEEKRQEEARWNHTVAGTKGKKVADGGLWRLASVDFPPAPPRDVVLALPRKERRGKKPYGADGNQEVQAKANAKVERNGEAAGASGAAPASPRPQRTFSQRSGQQSGRPKGVWLERTRSTASSSRPTRQPEEEEGDACPVSINMPPENFDLQLEGELVRGKLPLRVVRELNSLQQNKRSEHRSLIADSLAALAAGRGLPLGDYRRCVALLSFSTLDAHGLSSEAPERFGLRRETFASGERFKGALQPQLRDAIKRHRDSLECSAEDESFLKKVEYQAWKNGSGFFIKPPEFERLMLLRRQFADPPP